MQTFRTFSAFGDTSAAAARALLPVAAGASCTVCGVGAPLVLMDLDSPLRASFALCFLFAAPAFTTAFVLRDLEPWERLSVSVAVAVLIDLVAAGGMSALGVRTPGGGVVAVASISSLIFLAKVVSSAVSAEIWI